MKAPQRWSGRVLCAVALLLILLPLLAVPSFAQATTDAQEAEDTPWWVFAILAALAAVAVLLVILLRRAPSAREQPESSTGDDEERPSNTTSTAERAEVKSIGWGARISSVRLRRIRGFDDITIEFAGKGEPRAATLVIGKNGTNKTTLLRCIALGLADRVDANSLITESIGALISKGSDSGQIDIDLRGENGKTYEIRKTVHRSGDDKEYLESEGPSYKLFVCAYGAGRAGAGVDKGRDYRVHDSVVNLFDYSKKLLDTELTLRRLKDSLSKEQYEGTKTGLKRILNLAPEDDLRTGTTGGVEVLEKSFGKWVRLESWADGYRLTLSWLLDLFGWAMRAGSVDRDGAPRGIVLIDELDQHLHPSMQARVLGELKKILRGMQIVATTHSPILALGAEREELVALHRANGFVEKIDPIPDFSMYSAEDILTDQSLFDTLPHAPEANKQLEKYYRLVAIPADRRTRREERELKESAEELARRQLIARRDEAEDAEILTLLRQLKSSSEPSEAV